MKSTYLTFTGIGLRPTRSQNIQVPASPVKSNERCKMAHGKFQPRGSLKESETETQSRGKCESKRRRRSDDLESLDELESELDKEYNDTLADMAAESERVRSKNYISPVQGSFSFTTKAALSGFISYYERLKLAKKNQPTQQAI